VKVLLIDNYDSFTYNLLQLLEEQGAWVTIRKNDAIDFEEAAHYSKIVLSPGPGLPAESGMMMRLIDLFHKKASILGVCLGHQALVQYFGGVLRQTATIRHGYQNSARVTATHHLFSGLPESIYIGHYHSWIATDPVPEALLVTMRDDDDHVMAIKHQSYDLHGVQFHPESVMTPGGAAIIKNWLQG
jgi:anthranilate synthase component 2